MRDLHSRTRLLFPWSNASLRFNFHDHHRSLSARSSVHATRRTHNVEISQSQSIIAVTLDESISASCAEQPESELFFSHFTRFSHSTDQSPRSASHVEWYLDTFAVFHDVSERLNARLVRAERRSHEVLQVLLDTGRMCVSKPRGVENCLENSVNAGRGTRTSASRKGLHCYRANKKSISNRGESMRARERSYYCIKIFSG